MTPTLTELAQAKAGEIVTWLEQELSGCCSGISPTLGTLHDKLSAAFLTAAAQAEKEAKERAAELSALRAEVARVLRPFAEAAKVLPAALPDSSIVNDQDDLLLTYGDLRAAALLAKLDGGE